MTTHTKACLARAMISAIENQRDRDFEPLTNEEFEQWAGGDTCHVSEPKLFETAMSYIDPKQTGVRDSTCICHVRAFQHCMEVYNLYGSIRAEELATSYLHNGEFNTTDYLNLVKWTEGRGSIEEYN
jgi:hypothetical protein